MPRPSPEPVVDFQALFESAPDLFLVLKPDLTIVAVSNAYLKATMTTRDSIIGKGLFDIFPDNPNDPAATGTNNLRASLNRVIQNLVPDTMAVQKYDIRKTEAEGGGFEERFWSPINSPVLGPNGKLAYIIHRVEDVTEFVRSKNKGQEQAKLTEELRDRLGKTETEVFQRAQEIQAANSLLRKGNEELAAKEIALRESHENFSNAISSIKDYSILILDPQGKILTWNAGAERIKGYKASEVIGRSFAIFYPEEERAKGHPEELLRIAAREGRAEEESWRIRKDGARFLGDVVITALTGENGQLRGFIKVTRDVTEMKRAQEEIKQTNDFLNKILENIPNMIFVKDAKDLRFVRFNKAGEELLGIPRRELIGKNDYDFFPEKEADFFTAKDRKTLEEGKLLDIPEETIQTKDKGSRILHTKKFPVHGSDGKPQYLMGISEDITEQKEQEDLKIYLKALETSNKEMQDFVFVASHDLQEPLRKIQSFGEFLDEEYGKNLDETGRGYIERMRSAASRMQRLINDLLSLTRVTTKAQPFAPIELSQVLQEVLSDLETRIQEKGAKVEAGPLPALEADPTQMRQLFQNLLSNALKFQRPGVPPIMRISATVPGEGSSEREGRCRIRVEDNGIGFDNKYAEQIFKVFERLHGRDEYEGTGIGLAICRKVVERHGGSIVAEGFPGKGAAFTIVLPLQQKR